MGERVGKESEGVGRKGVSVGGRKGGGGGCEQKRDLKGPRAHDGKASRARITRVASPQPQPRTSSGRHRAGGAAAGPLACTYLNLMWFRVVCVC